MFRAYALKVTRKVAWQCTGRLKLAANSTVSFRVRSSWTPAGEGLGMQGPPTPPGACRAHVYTLRAAQGGLVEPRAGCSCPALAAYLSPPTGTP